LGTLLEEGTMSIQAGLWNSDEQHLNLGALARISEATAEYGPDGESIRVDRNLGMLYRPFHTTAESRRENQPYTFGGGRLLMTWDGRLDNRADLISQLSEAIDDKSTDCSIVAAAFEKWKTASFSRLIGEWALSVWNSSDDELILARDYMGIRPLFYHRAPNRIAWCSHLGPLALSGDKFELCPEYFAGFITLWPDAHLTPYCEIHSVPPGGFVQVCKQKATPHRYWAFNHRQNIRCTTDKEYEEQFVSLLRQAVRRRLRTDSPILADLSGGLDSSSIVCLADDIAAKGECDSRLVDTVSCCDRDEPDEEDFLYFTTVERARGRTGYHIDLRTSGDSFLFRPTRFVAAPGYAGRQELLAAKSEIVRKGSYKVLLSGTGGDEMLGQALDPRVQVSDLLRHLHLKRAVHLLTEWSLLLRRPWLQLVIDSLSLLLPASIRARMGPNTKVDTWINKGFAQQFKLAARQLAAVEGSWLWPPTVRDSFQTINMLSRQMTHSEPSTHETRYPYLDQNLVEFLISIPTDQLLMPGHRRSLMRRALRDVLPPEILSRQTKSSGGRFFVVTLEKHREELEEILAAPLLSALGYINESAFSAALSEVRVGHVGRDFLRTMRALSCELWLRDAVARGVMASPPRTLLAFPDATGTVGNPISGDGIHPSLHLEKKGGKSQ
jgi:asparagine synthase (glutamine-hydrolysing)